MSADTELAPSKGRALVTGATGYIGAALVPALLDAGWQVRVITRSKSGIVGGDGKEAKPWADAVEIVEGDATSDDALARALTDVDVAYYLIHSMDGGADFSGRDRELAEQFAEQAARCNVGRIVYLGGLYPKGETLSPHLASRVEVGQVFLDSKVPAAVLQAAVVLGDGSVSFDMLRYLTTRLPAMIAPSWLRNRIQPIAVRDVLHYLVAAASLPAEVNRAFDIGGPEILTYEEMIQRFAAVTGLNKRLIVPVPVLTPTLAGHWVGLITPISNDVAKPLVESLVHEVIVTERDIIEYAGPPPGGMTGFDEAVRAAMATATPDPVPPWQRLIGGLAIVGAVSLPIVARKRR